MAVTVVVGTEMTLAYHGVRVSDLKGGHLCLQDSPFDELLELLERQEHALANDRALTATQVNWLRGDIALVENELGRRWETGKEH